MQASATGGGVIGWATGVMATFGAPGAGLVLAIENVFPPIPSELVLPLAGFAAGRGEFSVLSAIVWTTAGATVGAVALYLVGMLARPETVQRWATKMPLVGDQEVDKAEAWFDRHGRKAVFLGRMVPGVRSFISIPAGQRRMPFLEFLALSAAGSAVWNTIFVYGGYALGTRWYLVEQYAGLAQVGVGVLLGALIVVMLVKRYRRHREVKRMEAPTQVIEVPPSRE